MKTLHPGRPLILFAVLSVCAAAIAGCGGGGTTTVTVTAPPPGTPPSSSKPSKGQDEETIEEGGAVAGYVDNVLSESGSVTLAGWAASPDLSEAASKVKALVGGEVVAEAVPAIERADVVEALGKSGLKESGFELNLPVEALECGSPASGVKVVAEFDGGSGPLNLGEGIKPKLNEAC